MAQFKVLAGHGIGETGENQGNPSGTNLNLEVQTTKEKSRSFGSERVYTIK